MKTITVIMKTRRTALAFPPHYCLQRGPAIANYSKTSSSSHKYAEVSCMFVHCFGMFVFTSAPVVLEFVVFLGDLNEGVFLD